MPLRLQLSELCRRRVTPAVRLVKSLSSIGRVSRSVKLMQMNICLSQLSGGESICFPTSAFLKRPKEGVSGLLDFRLSATMTIACNTISIVGVHLLWYGEPSVMTGSLHWSFSMVQVQRG